MPTTRSQGRHEPLQRLQTPPKRQRKQRPRRSRLAQGLSQREQHMRSPSMSLEPEDIQMQGVEPIQPLFPVVVYIDASTQTEEVVVLTQIEAADLQDRATALTAQKRNRDDESEDEPIAKRHQFSTPQNGRSNNLWMFGERANGDYPRTAPSKSAAGTSLRRPMRGPLSRRINFTDSPRYSVRASVVADRDETLDSMKPIEPEIEHKETNAPENEAQDENMVSHSEPQQQPPTTLHTPRRGLFGSLRGIVHKGWDIAASLTPLGARNEPLPTIQPQSIPAQVDYPRMQTTAEDEDEDPPIDMSTHHEPEDRPARPSRFSPDHPQRSSHYDHLHYIPANADSVDKAMTGEIEAPKEESQPLSPASRLKAQNPQLSDATIESILKKRERKAALDEERYGPQPAPEDPKVAPLFGPDSHYARGTVDPRFLPPTPLYGPSKKRKMESDKEQTQRPKSGGFGLHSDHFDEDVEVDNVDQPVTADYSEIDAPPAKRHKTKEPVSTTSTIPATPRSALKKPGFSGSIGRKSVAFGQSMSRDIRGHYGPAGQYKGSTFADEFVDDSRSLSSIDQSDVISPSTRLNTAANSGRKSASILDNLGASIPAIDFTLRDPNDQSWRPSLGNPRPGAFRVPDVDEEDPDETMTDDPPEQPQTPRMSHAELPGTPNTTESASFNESSIVHESTELALDKARSKAEKYKPKSSSRLSEVLRARSRSTSPTSEDEDPASTAQVDATHRTTAPAVKPVGAPPQPFVPRELDNITKDTDGMTDFEREHQYDSWAAGLEWDAPQTYEDAGTGSAFIHNLIRKNWTEEDSRRSEVFWAREFDEVDRAMEESKKEGRSLVLVTGMEEIEGY